MTPSAADIADIVDATADLLLVEGWAHRYARDAVGLCVLQALAVVCGLDRSQWSWLVSLPLGSATKLAVGVAAYRVLNAAVGCGVPFWNDDPERIEDEVHDLLRGTAKQLRERELEVRP